MEFIHWQHFREMLLKISESTQSQRWMIVNLSDSQLFSEFYLQRILEISLTLMKTCLDISLLWRNRKLISNERNIRKLKKDRVDLQMILKVKQEQNQLTNETQETTIKEDPFNEEQLHNKGKLFKIKRRQLKRSKKLETPMLIMRVWDITMIQNTMITTSKRMDTTFMIMSLFMLMQKIILESH